MPDKSKNAFSLVTFCPLNSVAKDHGISVFKTRKVLQDLATDHKSPLAKVPNTYLARFFILDDILFQSFPYHLDNLKSKYLVFTANIHGELDPYLDGMYKSMKDDIHRIWEHCVSFDRVKDSDSFREYIKKCKVKTTFFFNGSNDDSLVEQLKSLYIKQEFSKFVFAHQGASDQQILNDFKIFCNTHKPADSDSPTWIAGKA